MRVEFRAGAEGGHKRSTWRVAGGQWDARGQIVRAGGIPNFPATLQRARRRAENARLRAHGHRAILRRIVANDSAAQNLAVAVENPQRIQAGRKRMLQQLIRWTINERQDLARKRVQARNLGFPKIVEQQLRLLRGNFKRAREPAAQGAIQQGITDKKHKKDGKQGDGHGAADHLGFEARAQMVFAAFGPQAKNGARQNQREGEQCGGDDGGDGVKRDGIAPIFRLERHVERTEGEYRGKQQRQKNSGDRETQALAGRGAVHDKT